MAVLGLTDFILTHLFKRPVIFSGVVFDGDLRGHAAHGMRTAAVAGLDDKQRIGVHAATRHGDLVPVRENIAGDISEALDKAENVVPAAAQSGWKGFARGDKIFLPDW